MAVSATRKRAIGQALVNLTDDVEQHVLSLVSQYRAADEPYKESLIKQAVDTPQRARAQIQAWMSSHDAARSPGAAQSLLNDCLAAVGSGETLADINAALAALETQAQAVVDHVVNDGWTWDQVAAAIESAIAWDDVAQITFSDLPIPAGYETVWGEPY